MAGALQEAKESKEPASFVRRDHLREIEVKVQKQWAEAKIFEVDAVPNDEKQAKFFATFPYPYMNGTAVLSVDGTVDGTLGFAS